MWTAIVMRRASSEVGMVLHKNAKPDRPNSGGIIVEAHHCAI